MDHIHKHLSKNVGALAAVCEPWDHGKGLNMADIPRIVRNLVIGSLRLAALADITPHQLESGIQSWANAPKD